MMNRTRVLLAIGLVVAVLAVGLLLASQVLAASLADWTLPPRWEYATSFACGFSGEAGAPPAEPAVLPGGYATLISVHNPNNVPVKIHKKIVLDAPERGGKPSPPIAPTTRYTETIKVDHAISVDCAEIAQLLRIGGILPANATFIHGFVVIDSATAVTSVGTAMPLDVFATYTHEKLPGGPGVGGSMQVVPVPGRQLPAGRWSN